MVQSDIKEKLSTAHSPHFLDIVNESHKHNVPPGSESHFKVTIVSSDFEGLSIIQKHRVIYKTLSEEIAGKIHALSLSAYTPSQWEQQGEEIHSTPHCRGGE